MNLRARLVLALWLCVLVPTSGAALGAWWLLARPGARGAILAHQAFEPMMFAILGAALVGGAVATTLAVLLAPSVARPIRAAMEAADRIAAGTRSVRIDTEAGGEAGRLVQAFNRMARELDAAESRLRRAERLAAWRDIARQMAHEIKNPLTPIQVGVELLRKARARQLDGFDELFDEQTTICARRGRATPTPRRELLSLRARAQADACTDQPRRADRACRVDACARRRRGHWRSRRASS